MGILFQTKIMEIPNGNKHRGQLCSYEGFGTALLLISVNWGALGPSQATAVGWGIWTYILFLSPMCGGHVNPAVTLSILIKCGRQDAGPNFVTALCIMLSQVAGGFLGCLVIYLCINWDFPID